MARSYLVLSDLHLADVEDHADGWKSYKHSRYLFDTELARVIEHFALRGSANTEHVLVLNGDIFDFDLVAAVPETPPWPTSPAERKRGLSPTEPKAVWKLNHILQNHPVCVDAWARFVGAGNTLVYVMGNHDRELHFPAVQAALRSALAKQARACGLSFADEQLIFEPWFYYVPGEIYAEHGQQYDYYNAFRYLLAPTVNDLRGEAHIALPMGNLSNRNLMSQMGFFNPHTSDYILNVYKYASHWLRHYAFSRRYLLLRWLFGSISTILQLIRTKGLAGRNRAVHEARLEEMAERKNISPEVVRALDGLKITPITNRLYRVARELWIDRLLLALVMLGGTIGLALSSLPIWVKLMVPLSSFPLVYFLYEWFAHDEMFFRVERDIHLYALKIAQLLPTRVVTFGHTHVPRTIPLLPGVTYVNTGTWAPAWRSWNDKQLELGLRNALFVTIDGRRAAVQLETFLPANAVSLESVIEAKDQRVERESSTG